MPEPDTTAVVPVWGRYGGATLEEALGSLQDQEPPPRIVVVDNASNPPLAARAGADVVRSDARLTLGAARNLGLERVTTPYVLFWDADDLILPGTLEFLRERLDSDRGLVAVGASILEDEAGRRHRFPRLWTAPLTRWPSAFALAHTTWSLFPTTGCTLMRTDAVRAAGGFPDLHGGDDWVLGASLAFRGRIAIHARPGRVYRQHADSLRREQDSAGRLLARAAAVRRRVRTDRGIPGWARLALPLVAALQITALLVARPVARRLRRGS